MDIRYVLPSPRLFGGIAGVVTVWTAGLVVTQVLRGEHRNAVGRGIFNSVLCASLVGTAWSLGRQRHRLGRVLLVVVALLVGADAVVDVATAEAWYRPVAVTMALVLELPFAALCLGWVRVLRGADVRAEAAR